MRFHGGTGGWTSPPITSFVVSTTTPFAAWSDSQSSSAVRFAALIEYAKANQVDQILIGAPPPRGLTPWRGSVASQVMAEASCSVTVVRPRAGTESPVE